MISLKIFWAFNRNCKIYGKFVSGKMPYISLSTIRRSVVYRDRFLMYRDESLMNRDRSPMYGDRSHHMHRDRSLMNGDRS